MSRPRGRAAGASLAVVVLGALCVGGCGSDDDGAADDPDTGPPEGSTEAADARLDVEVERVDAGIHVTWTVANQGTAPLLVVDGQQDVPAPGGLVQGAYVTGGDGSGRGGGGVAEISRRVFAVPGDVEGVQQYATYGGELAPGASWTAVENVPVPLVEAPAAPEGGGDDLPDDPTRAVFCVGVAPVGEIDASPMVDAPGRWFVPHTEAGAAAQTLLCSDPFDL